jgi:hypothetical protein
MQLTVTLPDECAEYLPRDEASVAAVLSAGLRHWQGTQKREISDLRDVAEMLAGLPSPEEILAMHPSKALTNRAAVLLEKSKSSDELNAAEQAEWDAIMSVEHVVRVAKARALVKIKADHAAA